MLDYFSRNKATILQKLEEIARTLHNRLEKHQTSGRTLTLKVKFADYQQITRSRTFTSGINSLNVIIAEATALFETIELKNKSIRLLGISISNLDNEELKIVQLSLFDMTR